MGSVVYWSVVLCGFLSVFVGGQETDLPACRAKAVLKGIYTNLHDSITKYAIPSPETQHVDLLAQGLPLAYEEFNPGKKPRFATPGTLPINVIENALPLVDKIFPTGATVNPAPVNNSQSDKDYHFDSLSSTVDFVLTHMMVLPRNFSSEETLRAKYYLQELVPNPERVIQNETELPRFLLYDYYRELYLKEKEDKDDQMDSHRQTLTQQGYENWGVKKLPTLESNSDAAFQKWMIFGYKTEVEKELQYFDIDTHEDKLMSTRALFRSMAVYSERDVHVKVYPFSFVPENWFQVLKSKQPESADELRYRESLLKAQQALMNATKTDLANKTNEDVNDSLEKISDIMRKLRVRVQNAVDRLLQMEVECFAKVNLTVCGDIISSHTAFRLLLDDVAEHFEQAAYLESILNGRSQSISVLQQKLNEVAANIKSLDVKISEAENAETSDMIDLSTRRQIDTTEGTTCMEAGSIQFLFDSKQIVFDDSMCSKDTPSQPSDENKKVEPYCSDVRVPLNATQTPLWSVHSCAVDDDLGDFDDILRNFTQTMNTIESKLTASLHRVDVKRPWLDRDIFQDSDHFTMKRNRGIVSPGPIEPLNYFHQVAESGRFLMPQFTSSLIVASDITLFFPGLGSWRDEYDNDIDNHTNGIINILMKYTYAPTLGGGYGPFTLAPKGGSRTNAHNFRVERRNGGVLIRVPGAQVIGFVSTVFPKFPEDQGALPKPVSCTLQSETNDHQRRKRSTPDEGEPQHKKNIRELSNRLFSESFERSLDSNQGDQGVFKKRDKYIPSDSLDKLLKEADKTQNRIEKLIETIDMQDEMGSEADTGPISVPVTISPKTKDSDINGNGTQTK